MPTVVGTVVVVGLVAAPQCIRLRPTLAFGAIRVLPTRPHPRRMGASRSLRPQPTKPRSCFRTSPSPRRARSFHDPATGSAASVVQTPPPMSRTATIVLPTRPGCRRLPRDPIACFIPTNNLCGAHFRNASKLVKPGFGVLKWSLCRPEDWPRGRVSWGRAVTGRRAVCSLPTGRNETLRLARYDGS